MAMVLTGMEGEASAQATVPLTLTIWRVDEIDDPDFDELFEAAGGDYFAKVTIDALGTDESSIVSVDPGCGFGCGVIGPFAIEPLTWTFTRDVDPSAGPVSVVIELFDDDDLGSNDSVDIDPASGVRALTLLVDPNTGEWAGTTLVNQTFSQGDFADRPRGKVSFDVSVTSSSGDADGDGLLDGWELRGLDADSEGSIDVPLPSMGANVNHLDLFLELDTANGRTLSRDSIQAMKAAFAAAPATNPDGTSGINLWVDTGAAVDAAVREAGPDGTCGDGIDNGGDGFGDGSDPDCALVPGVRGWLDATVEDPQPGDCTDGADNDGDGNVDGSDPNCLVGDNLGGGTAIASLGACGLDGAFYAAKRNPTNFNPLRRLVFRYAISSILPMGCPVTGGGGEVGGNDFIDFNGDGGTIMHELGHNLLLRHGGNNDENCKPNYVSVMNYDNQFGITRVGGGAILDFSPPRISLNGTTRGQAPLPPPTGLLVENDLDETVALDATDASNMFTFKQPNGLNAQTVIWPLDQPVDWDGDGAPPGAGVPNTSAIVNVDTADTNGTPANLGDDFPADCSNPTTDNLMSGFIDWTLAVFAVPLRQFGDSADAAVNPFTGPEPTFEEIDRLLMAQSRTDLEASIAGLPDPVAAGRELTYHVTIRNHGPNPATSTQLSLVLDPRVSPLPATGCGVSSSVLTCQIGTVGAHTSQSIDITVRVAPDIVHVAGGPTSIAASAAVVNLVGTDTNATNNEAATTTTVVAVADLRIADSRIVDAPSHIVLARPLDMTLRKVVASDGPSSPIDASLEWNASASAGASVTPTSAVASVPALEMGSPRSIDETFTLSCREPGVRTYTLGNRIAPADAADFDPNHGNNDAVVTLSLDCIVPVAINIRPRGLPNPISLRGDATVAVLTTSTGEYELPAAFDTLTIDPLTVRFGTAEDLFGPSRLGAAEIHEQGHPEDSFELDERTRDGDTDMVFHFRASESGLSIGDPEACVIGSFEIGLETFTFFGCDSVVIRP